MAGTVVGSFIGLMVLGVLFGTLERFWPAIPGQSRGWRGRFVDIGFYLFNRLLTPLATGFAVAVGTLLIARLFGQTLTVDQLRGLEPRVSWIGTLPIGVQIVLFLLAADVIGYWSHRITHTNGWLWKVHAVHHSSAPLDWLSSVRVHPINDLIGDISRGVPLLLLGFNPLVIAGYVPVLSLFAILLHANVPWSFGPFRYLIASPVYHRWHHTTEIEGLNKDYAGLFPFVDLLFGTLYLPKDRQPTEFGILGDPPPASLHGQFLAPFRG